LRALAGLQAAGNTLFVVEHELDVIRRADWIVDVGPGAGEHGGRVLYSGPLAGLAGVEESQTARYVFAAPAAAKRATRTPRAFFELRSVSRNNLGDLDVRFPVGVLTTVTGVSGSGKSTLVSQVLVELLARALGQALPAEEEADPLEKSALPGLGSATLHGAEPLKRLVQVDQRPIGRTPRSNLATYTGLFDDVRKVFAATPLAKKRRYDAGRFSFNVAKGRCENCQGEGFVMVELLFLPSVYSPCPACKGARFNAKTLEVEYRGKTIADVLSLSVSAAAEFFADHATLQRGLAVVEEVGLGYLRLGQPATELSGGEAQRIKLATELKRSQRDGAVYILDEPTTGLHPADVERLLRQLQRLVDGGATVILVEHDMQVIAQSDWIIDLGPGAGDAGGQIVVEGPPQRVARSEASRTAKYLRAELGERSAP
jgi:excinuclease ABC subunit A